MNLKLIFLAIISLTHAQPTAQCASVRIRKEIRDLSQDERTKYVTAFANLATSGKLTELHRMHLTYFGKIHHTPQFLPFHRQYLVDLEVLLRTELGSQFTIPYCISLQDSSN